MLKQEPSEMPNSPASIEDQLILFREHPVGEDPWPSDKQLSRAWPDLVELRKKLGRVLRVEDIKHLIKDAN